MTIWIQALASAAIAIAVLSFSVFVVRVLWLMYSGAAAHREAQRISEETADRVRG